MIHDELYKETILELNRNPLNKKALVDFDVEMREFNPVCGDDCTVRIKFAADDTISDIGWQGSCCAISSAAMSLVSDELKGKNKLLITQMNLENINKLFGVDIIPTRVQCALLGLKAVQKALLP
ncbi:MAG: iron-sulfur cluster assembly scaffold protein [Candidatus Magasanikbacteria bacterium]|nr:iron-sulfur cluster assembly scaffold protein [Candidatus Magasanikbacteria bacterium]